MSDKKALYKVLIDGKSCHGGDMEWSLPVQQDDGTWTPGEVMSVEGKLSLCEHGLHLTTDPDGWWRVGCRYYEAEITGSKGETDGDKCVVSACRLLREVPIPDYLQRCGALIDEVKGIKWFSQKGPIDPAWRAFTAPTWDSAWASARDSAWDSARASALDSALDSAWASARDAARASAWDAARDSAWESARASAWDAALASALASAWESARDAAQDAALYVVTTGVCADLPIDQKHRDHVQTRMDVWRRGYGVYCDVDGVLYVYGIKKEE